MMKKNIFVICYFLMLSLLFAGCTSEQLSTPTIAIMLPSPTISVVSPTPSVPVQISSVVLEPVVFKNGDSFFVRVKAHLSGHPVQVDVSQLDTTQKSPIILGADGVDSYSSKITISYGNVATNGRKTITVTTLDETGKSVVATTQAELQNPAPILDANPPNDNFDSPYLFWSKWKLNDPKGGKLSIQDGKLLISSFDQYNSGARIYSAWAFPGDFDIQVDFQNGEGWVPPEIEHTDMAVLGVEVGNETYHVGRLMNTKYDIDYNRNVMMLGESLGNIYEEKSVNALSGKLRLIRIDDSLIYLYDVGDGWVELGRGKLPVSPARVYIGIQSVYHSQVFSTYFDNFLINSGRTIH
jgi:hypothetical protein